MGFGSLKALGNQWFSGEGSCKVLLQISPELFEKSFMVSSGSRSLAKHDYHGTANPLASCLVSIIVTDFVPHASHVSQYGSL